MFKRYKVAARNRLNAVVVRCFFRNRKDAVYVAGEPAESFQKTFPKLLVDLKYEQNDSWLSAYEMER